MEEVGTGPLTYKCYESAHSWVLGDTDDKLNGIARMIVKAKKISLCFKQ